MTKIDIISGFLGAGKTTLIKKLIEEGLKGQKVVLIENEFGEIGIDGGFLKESGIQINEMNSGCICCSLVGDFNTALKDVLEQYTPDRIIIEPSGVGKLSDVMKAVQKVVDAEENVVLKEDKLEKAVALLRDINGKCPIVTTPWEELSGAQLLEVMEGENDFAKELMEAAQVCPECGHHHDHGEECHEHHHDHDHECHEHHHDHDHECHEHHHDHDHECHEHHHDHDHECHEHHHDHDHDCCGHDHHHHHADEVFTSWGKETPKKYTEEGIRAILDTLSKEDSNEYGIILRAKGIVPDENGKWIHFDLVPGEDEVRYGSAEYTGRICVIGSKLNEDKLEELFGL